MCKIRCSRCLTSKGMVNINICSTLNPDFHMVTKKDNLISIYIYIYRERERGRKVCI